jgi:hypothetical protein
VHGDLYGPILPATPSGGGYFLLLVDDKSRFMWLSVMSTKDQAAAAIKMFQGRAEAESGLKLGVLRTDRGGEFTSVEFVEYCAAEGVRRQLTASYSPQQNGVVERRNGMVVAMAQSMLKAKGLLGWFWGEAVNTVVYILNRCPTKSVTGMTPFEAWYGKKPAVHHLKTFGCLAYVRNTTPHLKKLEDRGRKMIFVGYERGTKAYRAYDPVTGRVHITRDVIFNEEAQWDWSHDEEGGTAAGNVDDTFTVEFTTRYAPGEQEEMSGEEAATPGTPLVATSAWRDGPSASPPGTPPAATMTPSASTPPVHFVTPPPLQGDKLDADHDDDVPLRFREMDDVMGPGSLPGYAVRDLGDGRLLAVSVEEPASLAQLQKEVCWRRVMEEELRSIEENRTWTLTELPQGQRAIGFKWVFKVKSDEHGAVVRHKARLVVKGYAQRHGIDYDEVFAPVARMEAVRLLLALAAHEGWEVHHMDVKTAFLNGDLQEVVFVEQAPGFVQAGQEHKVY